MKSYKALANTQIDKYFKFRPDFGGCYAKDMLPKRIGNKFYILNLDNERGGSGGTHWTLIYNLNTPAVLYFDPFGVAPPINGLKFMKTAKKPMYYSSLDLQDIDSELCGYYCIYVADQMSSGRDFLDIVAQDFNNNQENNDRAIMQYFKSVKL